MLCTYIQIHDSKIRKNILGRLRTGNGYIFLRRRTFALALEDNPIAWVKRGIPRRVRGIIFCKCRLFTFPDCGTRLTPVWVCRTGPSGYIGWLAGTTIPMPESALSPRSGTMNLATVDPDPEPEFLNFYGTQASVPYNMLPLSASHGISNIPVVFSKCHLYPSSSRTLISSQYGRG